MGVTFGVLGPLQVVIDGVEVTPRAPKERALLALLLINHGRVVGADRLIEELWPDLTASQAHHVLHVRVAAVRKLFQGADAGPLLQFVNPGYRLAVAAEHIDCHRFSSLVGRARGQSLAGDLAGASSSFREALALWRGDALADVQACLSLETEAARLEDEHRSVLEEFADAELACGRHREWITALEAMASEEPFRERRWALLMLGLYRCGRQADALRAFQRARAALDQLGLEPGPELRSLERAISAHDEALNVADTSRVVWSGSAVGSRPVSAPRHNLPVGLTSFVGRIPELEEIHRLMGASRLVTLTGVGGTGKTRLALQAAAAASEHYPDGVWLVELAAHSDGTAFPSAVTTALGIPATGYDSPEAVEELVCGHLASRRVLLVFDSCEHMVGAVARFVHTVLAGCPDVSVLATSRELLGVPGEVAMAVPPLSLPPAARTDMAALMVSDAVTLFCERAQEARPQFRLTAANAEDVARICRRLDGIPLAIELAAARVRMLSVKQIAERLDDACRLLTGGPRTAVLRHHTLRAALDWSHDLLSPAERVALRRLAVFPDRFDLDAAGPVMTWEHAGVSGPGDGDDVDGFELLSRLVDKSLVVVDRAGERLRYRLLEPVRQYAAEKLAAAGETEAARDRHRDHFLAHATLWRSQLYGLTQASRLFADRANYLAALEWSWHQRNIEAALCLVVLQSTSWLRVGDPQGRLWLERILAEPEPADHWARADALSDFAHMIHDSGQPEPGRDEHLMRQATAMARRLGDIEAMAAIGLGYGELELALGKTTEARSLIEASLVAYEHLGSTSSVGWCHEHLGWVAVADHDHEQARTHFERAVELAQADAGGWLAAHALAALAPLTVLLGDAERGLRLAEEAIAAARRIAARAVLVMALVRATETMILAADCRRAGQILEELLELLHDFGSRRWLADALEMGALVLESQGDPAAAVEVLQASEALRVASGELGGGIRALAAEVHSSRDRLIAALGPDRYADHQARARKRSPEEATADVLAGLARVHPQRPTIPRH